LDGKINVDDYGRIDFNVELPGAIGWYNGDFNYDGKINVDDYGIIDLNVGIQGAAFSTTGTSVTSAMPSSIPEPTTIPLALLASLTFVPHRRRAKNTR
jgi:hypothetical protein